MQQRLRASLFDRVFLGLEYAICLTFFGLCIIFKRSVYQLCHECLRILPTRLMKSLKSFLQCWHLGRFNRQVFHLQEKHNSFNSKFPRRTTSLILSHRDLQNLSSKAGQNEIVKAFISSMWRTSSGQKSTNLNYQRLRGGGETRGGGGYSTKFHTGRLRHEVQPLTLVQGSKLTFQRTCKVLLVRIVSTSQRVRPLANSFPLFGRHG